jgi:hypothetical protein
VVLRRFVEGGGDDLTLDGSPHVGDLLRSLADERDHEEDVRVVLADPVGDVLEQHRLAGLGRAHDQGALPLADRVDEVHEALREVLRVRLEVEQVDGVNRREVTEVRPAAGRIRIDAVDRVNAEQAPVLLALARGAHRPVDAIADPQPEAADLAGADVHVVRPGHQPVAAEEAVALVHDIEDAGAVVLPEPLGLTLEDPVHEVVASVGGNGLDIEVRRGGAQLGRAHLAELGRADLRTVGGAVQLLVVRHAGGALALRAPSGTAVPNARIGGV